MRLRRARLGLRLGSHRGRKNRLHAGRLQLSAADPVLISRFILNMPAGWEARGTVFNHEKLDPQVPGASYTWELHNLPWIEHEDYSPSLSALAPRLVVSYFPPPGNPGGLQGLKDWTAVSTWLSPLVDPPAAVTDAVRAKAQQLTANAPGELDKIRAIAAFAQQTNYVEVSLNVTRGGGYTPRAASESLARNYGDCKDKATLMRALLKAVGIDAYLTTISADDRTYVRPEWASPYQFNHAIIAVKVSDGVKLPTVIPDSPLGRLLDFRPHGPHHPSRKPAHRRARQLRAGHRRPQRRAAEDAAAARQRQSHRSPPSKPS